MTPEEDTVGIPCPVAGCTWIHSPPPVDPRALEDGALAEVFGWGVYAANTPAVPTDFRSSEEALRAHLPTHGVLEWVTTVGQLHVRVGILEGQLRDALLQLKSSLEGTT